MRQWEYQLWKGMWTFSNNFGSCALFLHHKLTILNRRNDEKSIDFGCSSRRLFSALFMWNGRKMPVLLLC